MAGYHFVRLSLIKTFLSGLILVTAVLTSACQFPSDANDTLKKVQDGALKVGVTENPPWVIRTKGGASGVEADMLLVFADKLNAEVEWHWGTETELMEALAQHQLHMVIGGLTLQSPLKKLVNFTEPYYSTRITIGFPPNQTVDTDIDGVKVAVPVVNQVSQSLESRGAVPQPMQDMTNLNMPVAQAEWWLRAKGYQPGPWNLFTEKHVMAVAEGENAFMMRVQKHISQFSGIEAKLEEWAKQSKD
ncbi:transporter substrate-binding domain-containing protein [Methylophaga sp.]|uniref:substrate-binding periplasmic protein n=1 Tax=Methylophaga sp. TaxID=2024840 RepID=UPI0014000773|nr:transporter substrate-binding domain-containing protein [Methylophaga sp.]MTI63877.1 amino acid ABC transporter substrate-binding protein [Methylophaga sp.]